VALGQNTVEPKGLEHKMSGASEYFLLLNVTESYVFIKVTAAETVIKQQKF